MKRNGVVMVVTLVLVMVLTLAILKSTTITQKYFSDLSNTQFLVQFNRTFLDISKVVSEATKEIKDAKMLSLVIKMPIIISDDASGLQGILKVNSAASALNINQIVDDNNTINQPMYDVLYSALSDYHLGDTLFLMALILDAIDKDSNERSFESEFTYNKKAKMSDGGIFNKRGLYEILDVYSKLRYDNRVYQVPWDKLVRFSGKDMDYNYLSDKIKEVLQREYGITPPYDDSLVEKDEDLFLTKEQKKVFKALNIKYYVPNLKCVFEFTYKDKSASADFTYHTQKRRIENIETIF